MRRWRPFAAVLSSLSLVTLLGATRAEAIPVGVADFQDGTTMGWFVPGATPNPPTNVPTGGPSGAGDAYLQLVATGGAGPGSRLAVLNETQWTGDFLAAGITAISMDVNNFGPDDLVLRLLFEDFDAPGPPANLATTSIDVVVPSGSGWMPVSFDLSNLTALLGDADEALREVDVIRIFHNPEPTFPGPGVGIPVVNATLGVDNIAATAVVPEPATALLLVGGLGAALLRRRRRL